HAVTLDAPQVQSCFSDAADVAPAAPKAKLTIVKAIALRVMSVGLGIADSFSTLLLIETYVGHVIVRRAAACTRGATRKMRRKDFADGHGAGPWAGWPISEATRP